MMGTVIAGRYRLRRSIGRGAMGEVFEAVDEDERGAPVAVKVLHEEHCKDKKFCARFSREAEIAGRIHSPHVAGVLGAGLNRQERLWIVFEYLPGESLLACVQREGKLKFGDVAWVVDQALHGLDAAHQCSIVHRDVKLSNLFLEQLVGGVRRLRVLDFGVARLLPSEGAVSLPSDGATSSSLASRLTTFGVPIGSPVYMSPEQIFHARDADERADLYGLGITAYGLLTGRLPFEQADVGSLIDAKCSRPAPTLTEVSGAAWPSILEGWLAHMVAINRNERFDSARAALDAWTSVCAAIPDGQERENR
ncbi:MAG TPA: serine/threonine-protein kinase [Polyangiaceae bacterium]|nr:serine/threonine-protein kinase [Polyangiaceae bacterium]